MNNICFLNKHLFSRRKECHECRRGLNAKYVVCSFTLCTDVFDGVLKFGTRKQLSKVELVGRKFHYVINNRFMERPFLVLHSIRTILEESIFAVSKEFNPFINEETDSIEYKKFSEFLLAPGVPVQSQSDKVFSLSNLMIMIDIDL